MTALIPVATPASSFQGPPQPRPLPAQNRGSLSSPLPARSRGVLARPLDCSTRSLLHGRQNEPRHFQPCREVWGASGPQGWWWGGRGERPVQAESPLSRPQRCADPCTRLPSFSPAPRLSSRRSLERVSTQPGPPAHTHTLTKAHAPEPSRAPPSSPAHSARERAYTYTPRPRGFVLHTRGPRNRLCVPSCECRYSRFSPTRGAAVPGLETPILGGWEGYPARSLG